MRELSPGETPEIIDVYEPSQDPEALDPTYVGPQDPNGFGGAGPWYSTPPGGMDPRFLEGVPRGQFQVTPFDHVVNARRATPAATQYNPGRPWGNTGFQLGPAGSEIGDLTENEKTGLTGLFMLGALGLTLWIYSK